MLFLNVCSAKISFKLEIDENVSLVIKNREVDCPFEIRLPKGQHFVVIKKEGYLPDTQEFDVQKDEVFWISALRICEIKSDVKFELNEEEPSTIKGTFGWGLLGFGLSTLAAGVFFEAHGYALEDEYEWSNERDDIPYTVYGYETSIKRFKTGGWVLISVGAVSMISGVLLLDPFDWWSSESESSSFRVVPVVGTEGYSISIESVF